MDAANFLFEHPRGPIMAWFSAEGLRELRLPREGDESVQRPHLLHGWRNDHRARRLHTLLEQYFAGVRVTFDEIPLDFGDATPFQQQAWQTAREIPWGATLSYGELASRMARDAASARAVGSAMGANPIPIVVPCHRVLGANGDLVNYSAGLEWKRELLELEGSLLG